MYRDLAYGERSACECYRSSRDLFWANIQPGRAFVTTSDSHYSNTQGLILDPGSIVVGTSAQVLKIQVRYSSFTHQ
jgi:hypothetical protein